MAERYRHIPAKTLEDLRKALNALAAEGMDLSQRTWNGFDDECLYSHDGHEWLKFDPHQSIQAR